jgi:hypothetical protein
MPFLGIWPLQFKVARGSSRENLLGLFFEQKQDINLLFLNG